MDRSTVRTFNSAKKFAEEILHPLIDTHKNAKLTFRLGAVTSKEAEEISPQAREIRRYNALKERIAIQQTLLTEIQPTIKLNGRKSEVELIKELSDQLDILEENYDSNESEILIEVNSGDTKVRKLGSMAKKVNSYLDKIYDQLQFLMTKNKLLFAGDDNEFLDNEDLMEKIKTENISV